MRKLLLVAMLIAGLVISPLAYAHGGRTDKKGCHRDKSTGTRHCH